MKSWKFYWICFLKRLTTLTLKTFCVIRLMMFESCSKFPPRKDGLESRWSVLIFIPLHCSRSFRTRNRSWRRDLKVVFIIPFIRDKALLSLSKMFLNKQSKRKNILKFTYLIQCSAIVEISSFNLLLTEVKRIVLLLLGT